MSENNGRQLCGALNALGKPCQLPVTDPLIGRCELHGGHSVSGPLSDNWKTGKRSKYNPAATLAQKYHSALNDPNFLSQRNEIALMDARIMTLVERLEDDQNIPTWRQLSKTWDQFLLAVRAGNERDQTVLVGKLDMMIESANRHIDVWEDIQKAMDQRRKLTESERKSIMAHQSSMTIEEVMQIMNTTFVALRDIVKRYADKDTARHIVIEAASYHRKLLAADGAGDDS